MSQETKIIIASVVAIVIIIIGFLLIKPIEKEVAIPEISDEVLDISFYPNYDDVKEVIEDDNATWALVSGGVLKIDEEVKLYTVEHGLINPPYLTMVKRGDDIWVSSTSDGISRFNIPTEEITNFRKNENDSFSNIKDGLTGNGYYYLAVDPYTDELWASGDDNISRFLDDYDKWITYTGTDYEEIKSSYGLFFTEDHIVFGDVYEIRMFNKKENEWMFTQDLDADLYFSTNTHVVLNNGFLIEAFPKNIGEFGYGCGEQEEKLSIIIKYSDANGWSDYDLNNYIEPGEMIAKADFNDNIWTLYLNTDTCAYPVDTYKMVRYDVENNILLDVKQVDAHNLWEDELKLENERYLEVLDDVKEILRKDVIAVDDEAMLLNTLPQEKNTEFSQDNQDFKYVDFDLREIEVPWFDDIKKQSEDIINTKNYILKPLSCNNFNNNEIYLTSVSLNYGEYPMSSETNIIARYNKDTSKLEELKALDYWKGEGYYSDPFYAIQQPFYCQDDKYLSFNEQGVMKYDFDLGRADYPDEDNFIRAMNDRIYYVVRDDKLYYYTEQSSIGIFDIETLTYDYLDLDFTYTNMHFWPYEIELEDISDDYVYFTNFNFNGLPFIYNIKENEWDQFWVLESDKGYIIDIRENNGIVFIMRTDEDNDVSLAYMLEGEHKPNGLDFTFNYYSLYETRDKLIIPTLNGVWVIGINKGNI